MPRQCLARLLLLSSLNTSISGSEHSGSAGLECHVWHTYFCVTQCLQISLTGYGSTLGALSGSWGLHSVRGVALRLTSMRRVLTECAGACRDMAGMEISRSTLLSVEGAQHFSKHGPFLASYIGLGPWHSYWSQGCHLVFKSFRRLDWNCMAWNELRAVWKHLSTSFGGK